MQRASNVQRVRVAGAWRDLPRVLMRIFEFHAFDGPVPVIFDRLDEMAGHVRMVGSAVLTNRARR